MGNLSSAIRMVTNNLATGEKAALLKKIRVENAIGEETVLNEGTVADTFFPLNKERTIYHFEIGNWACRVNRSEISIK